MKKTLYLILLLITGLFLFSCKQKVEESPKQEQNIDIVDRDYVNPDEQNSNENEPKQDVDINNNTDLQNLDLDQLQISVVEESVDYNEFEYQHVTNVIFSISSVKDVTQRAEDTAVLLTEITGSISGIPGTFKLIAPYSDSWVRGDKAFISYDVCYPDETNTYIRNIHIDSKYTSEYIKELERKEQELQEAIRLQEEEEQKKIEESEKNEQAKRVAEQRRQVQLLEQQRLQEELARLEAEKNNPPIVQEERTGAILIPGSQAK